jgi:hypothetical protein
MPSSKRGMLPELSVPVTLAAMFKLASTVPSNAAESIFDVSVAL